MSKTFTIDITAWPLTLIPLILVIHAVLAIQLYKSLNRKTELYVAICLGTAFIVSIIPYRWIGASSLQFWSAPFQWTTIAIVLVIVTNLYFSNQLNVKQVVIISLASMPMLLSVNLHGTSAGVATGISLTCVALYLYYEWRNGRLDNQVPMYYLISLATLGFIGQWIPYDGGRFLFSVTLLLMAIYQILSYFNRIIELLQVASVNSVTDTLTGLYNKNFMNRKAHQLALQQEIEIIFLDIDNFKQLNDTKGHSAGDVVLKEVGNLLQEIVGVNGYACRYGGEEMVAILHTGVGEELAGRICRQIDKKTEVTVSVGVAKGTGDATGLIKSADMNMYTAKQNGKNQVCY